MNRLNGPYSYERHADDAWVVLDKNHSHIATCLSSYYAQMVAAALADAENRAAWEGWDRHRNWAKAFWAQNYGDVSIVLSSMEERYGPRPADAAKEAGNE